MKRILRHRPSDSSSPATPKPTFLPDDPLDDLKLDRFGHSDYLALLLQTISAVDAPTVIGLFGSYGTGKTTLTRAPLQAALREKRTAMGYVYFDAWRFEGDPLRRQVLLEMSNQLEEGGWLKKSSIDLQHTLYETHRRPAKRRLNFGRPEVIGFVLIVLLQWPLYTLFVYGTTRNVLLAAAVAFIAAILIAAARAAPKLVTAESEIVERKMLSSAEEFSKAFDDISTKTSANRIVMVIDNIDRCDPRRALDVLSTVSTFMSGPSSKVVFVIPCDEGALRRYLEDRMGLTPAEAAEYLRKFFNVPLRLNPFLDVDLTGYVSGLLTSMGLGDQVDERERAGIVHVITQAFRGNPRQAKQFLNTLAADYLLARMREADPTPSIRPPISDHPAMLAKILALRERWPVLYDAIGGDNRLLDGISSAAQGTTGYPNLPPLVTPDGGFLDPELQRFLVATRSIRATNVRAFVHFKQRPEELGVEDYQGFVDAALQGLTGPAADYLDRARSENRSEYLKILRSSLREELASGRLDSAFNVAQVALVAIRSSDPTAEDLSVGRELFDALSQQLLSYLQLLPAEQVAETWQFADAGDRSAIQHAYVQLLSGPSEAKLSGDELTRWRSTTVRALCARFDDLDPHGQAGLKAAIRARPEDVESVAVAAEFEATRADLPMTAFQMSLAHLQDPTGAPDSQRLEKAALSVWRLAGSLADLGERARLTNLLTSLLTVGASPDKSTRGLELTVEFGPLLAIPGNTNLDGLAAELLRAAPSLPAPNKQLALTALVRLAGQLDQPRAVQVSDLIASGGLTADMLAHLVSECAEASEALGSAVGTATVAAATKKLAETTDERERVRLATVFVDAARAHGPDVLVTVDRSLIAAQSFATLGACLNDQVAVFESLGAAPQLIELCAPLLDALRAAASSVKVSVLGCLLHLQGHFPAGLREQLRDLSVSLLSAGDHETAATGREIYAELVRANTITINDRVLAVGQLASLVASQSDLKDPRWRLLLGILVPESKLMDENALSVMANALSRMSSAENDELTRRTAFEYLTQMDRLPTNGESIVTEARRIRVQEGDSELGQWMESQLSAASGRTAGSLWSQTERDSSRPSPDTA